MSFAHPQTREFVGSPSISPMHSSSSSSLPYNNDYQKQATPPTSSTNKISPAVLLVIVILALLFFISGLLHLLVRLLVKQRSSPSSMPESNSNRFLELPDSSAFRRQLQQLFHLHDSGLDQASIDALPVFLYKDIAGSKEPFDCAVCLCEFSELDKLRLIPTCKHAFHIGCIDTWLLSNSTCPLCRGPFYSPGLAIENHVYGFEHHSEETGDGRRIETHTAQKALVGDIIGEKRVFSIRLGKFKNMNNRGVRGLEKGEGETSSLGARRCYSMGSYQYIVADLDLQVALRTSNHTVKGRDSQTGNCSVEDDAEGKKIKIGSKNESFSVSKIWLWSKNGQQTTGSDNHVLRAN